MIFYEISDRHRFFIDFVFLEFSILILCTFAFLCHFHNLTLYVYYFIGRIDDFYFRRRVFEVYRKNSFNSTHHGRVSASYIFL